jgi:Leucine-rich repeat (LRR) protein
VTLTNVSSAESTVTFTCVFDERFVASNRGYTCTLFRPNVETLDQEVLIVNNHQPGKTNDDVQNLFIGESPSPFVISQLFRIFRNLKALQINLNSIERIQDDAFNDARNLEFLAIYDGTIKILQNGLFKATPNLVFVDILRNQLEVIEACWFESIADIVVE